MGKKDIITKRYLEQPEIFADAFNYYLFNGKSVIKPTDLKEQDPTELAVMKKMGKIFTRQKFRDVLRLCTVRHSRYATLVLLGIEEQTDISYVMPVRDYLYDALNYADQIASIQKRHEEAKDLKGAEYISGFSKKDKLIPVITLCICFDKTHWDGPKSLYDMFEKMDPQIQKFVNNYTLNLITPGEVKDFTKFSSGLGLAMEFIQNSSDTQKLRDIMETREEYSHVDVQTVDIINAYTEVKISKKKAEDGHMSMCAGMKGLIEEGRLEGLREGQEKGRKKGLEEGANMLAKLIKLLNPDSKDYDKALNGTPADRKRLYRKYKIID